MRIRRNTELRDTLSEVKEIFIADKESQGKAQKTLICYEESIDKFIKYNGDCVANDLNIGNIIAYRRHMVKEEELKIASINHYLRDLRTFINYAIDNGFISNKIKVEMVSGQEEIKDTYTDEELAKLLRRPNNINDFVEWRTYVMVCYILATGARADSVVNISMADIDLTRRIIRIAKAKNKKVSEIAIDKQITSILRRYIKDWRNDATLSEKLFCNIGGSELTTNAARQAFAKYCKDRGVDKTSMHLLRHTFAKLYILNGGSEFKLQQMLGHSSLTMTRHYVNMFGADLARDIDNVSPLVNITKSGGMEKKIKRSK